MKRASEEGYQAEVYSVDTANANLQGFRDFIKGRTWDGVMIGWGIRGAQEHSELFEKLVNRVTADVKPVPKFIFSTKPDGFVDAIQRVLDDKL